MLARATNEFIKEIYQFVSMLKRKLKLIVAVEKQREQIHHCI
jgi:hypothetical protein